MSVNPGDATVLVLRPFVPQPGPLVIGTNLGQSSPSFEAYSWDARNARLQFTTRGAGAYSLPILVPAELRVSAVQAATGNAGARLEADGRVAVLDVVPDDSGMADVAITLERRP